MMVFIMRATSKYFECMNLRRIACSSDLWIRLAS